MLTRALASQPRPIADIDQYGIAHWFLGWPTLPVSKRGAALAPSTG